MDFENSNLTSVFAHNAPDAPTASSNLLQKLSSQINGKLVRISPHAFIYMSHGENDGEVGSPCCHMVTTTDTHHYVGSLPVENTCDIDDGSCTTIALANDVLNTADEAPIVDTPPVVAVAPVTDVVEDDDNNSETNEVEPEVESVNTMPTAYDVPVQSVNSVIPYTDTDHTKASALIEQAMRKKYSGTVIRHSPSAFTHVRSNGTIDRVNTNDGNHMISSHIIK